MPRGGAKPGERRGGRKAGTPNKTTAAVKAALQEAFDGIGGVSALKKWGKENPTEFYKLWAKLLPQETQVSNLNGESFKVYFEVDVGKV